MRNTGYKKRVGHPVPVLFVRTGSLHCFPIPEVLIPVLRLFHGPDTYFYSRSFQLYRYPVHIGVDVRAPVMVWVEYFGPNGLRRLNGLLYGHSVRLVHGEERYVDIL